MLSVQEAAGELLARRKARRGLHDYIIYTSKGTFKTSIFSETVCAALDQFILDVNAGKRPILVLQAPPQHGKQIADETPVLTVNGWTTHGSLVIGDIVFSSDGSTTKIIAVSEKSSSNARIEFTDGSVIYCHERHEWTVNNRDLKREVVIETAQMLQTSRSIPLQYQLPISAPIVGIESNLSVPPYTLGAWLGDVIAIRSITLGDWGKRGNCVQVDHPSGIYLVGKSLLPTHNSEIVSRKLPAYLLGSHSRLNIATASYSEKLANSMSQHVRRNLFGPEHQRLWPSPAERGKYDLNRIGEFTAPGGTGNYVAVGVGTGLTGVPVDIGIIDDPTKDAQEALSPVTKETHWNWYQSVFNFRLSECSGQIIMATSWAQDDLPGRILEMHKGSSRLIHLPFPAINDPHEVGYNPDLPLGPLCPTLHSLEQLLEFKHTTSDYWWSALYQQSPQALGGNVFKEEGIQYYLPKDLPKNFDKVICSLDATFKDTDGTDFVVFTVWGKKGSYSYLLDLVCERMSFTKTVKTVIAIKEKWPQIREFLIEDKANGPAVIDVLKPLVPGLIAVEPDGSKLARAHAVTWVWEARNVFLPSPDIMPAIRHFISELTKFPAAAHDDQVDSTTQALRHLYPAFGRLKISDEAIKAALGIR